MQLQRAYSFGINMIDITMKHLFGTMPSGFH